MAISQDAITETYADIEKMIFHMAWKAVNMFGGDWDDYFSIANEAFIDAYNSFDPDQTQFTTWLWWNVRGRILHSMNKTKMDQMTTNIGDDVEMIDLAEREHFDFQRFYDELSIGAKRVVMLVIDSPWDLAEIAFSNDGPECIRSGMFKQLRRMGWTVAMICDAFVEVREALT